MWADVSSRGVLKKLTILVSLEDGEADHVDVLMWERSRGCFAEIDC